MKIIDFIKEGMLSAADAIVEPRAYPQCGGFKRDHERLRGDVHAVGTDMKKAIKKHGGKQSHKPPGA